MTQKFLHTSRQEEDFPCAVWHSSWVWLQKRPISEHFTQVREKWCFEQMRFLQTSHGPLSQGIIRNYAQIQWSGEIFLLWVCVLSATTLLYHLTRDYFKGLSSAMDLTSQTWQECNILQSIAYICKVMHIEEDNSHHIFKMSSRLLKSAWKTSWTLGLRREWRRSKRVFSFTWEHSKLKTEEQKEQPTFPKPENLSWQELNLGPLTTRLYCNPGLVSGSSEIQYQPLINNLWNLLKNYHLFQQLKNSVRSSKSKIFASVSRTSTFRWTICRKFPRLLQPNVILLISQLFFLHFILLRIFVQDLLFHHSFKIESLPWLLSFLAPPAPELIPLYLWTLPPPYSSPCSIFDYPWLLSYLEAFRH